MATKRSRSPDETERSHMVSPKRSRSQSIPVYDWSPQEVSDALLKKGIPEEVGKILQGTCFSGLEYSY